MTLLASHRYGKSRVRLVKVRRAAVFHEIVDLAVDVQLEGAFETVFTHGDNQACLPTDTMKNTVYALARQDPIESIESFAIRLARHLAGKPGVSRARVGIMESRWERLSAGGRPHPHAFIRPAAEQWSAVVTAATSRCDERTPGAGREPATCNGGSAAPGVGTPARLRDDGGGMDLNVDLDVVSGLANLYVLKTKGSAFEGFLRDEYTTLADTRDRILATSITAAWKYRRGAVDFNVRERIRDAMLATFAAHDSESVQHTLYAMAEAALAAAPDVCEVTLSLPNQHHLLVDLTPFGLDNPNEVFVATDQPYGLIEATVRRQP